MRRARLIRVLVTPAVLLGLAGSTTIQYEPAVADAVASDHQGLRVMTYNIHGIGADVDRIAEVIRAEEPDVVTLTEVHDDDDLPEGHGDQPSELAELLAGDGYRYAYFHATEIIPWHPDDGGGIGCGGHAPGGDPTSEAVVDSTAATSDRAGATYSCGNMMLSRFPIYTDSDDPRGPAEIVIPTDYVHPETRDRRGLLGVTVQVPGIGDVRVFVTHMTPPQTDLHVQDQLAQARTILEHVESVNGPTVLAGDLNIRPTDFPEGPTANTVIRSWIADAGLVDSWTQVSDSQDGVTVTESYGNPEGDHPDRRIDYVYVSAGFSVGAARVSVVDADASDHLAVIADLRLREPGLRAHGTALAGPAGLSGWGHAAVDRDGQVKLTACKNRNTVADDGTVVRVSLHQRPGAEPLGEAIDDGTSRDRCTTVRWSEHVRPSAVVRACLMHDDDILGCRDETIGRG